MTDEKLKSLVHIQVSDAYLCGNCDCIGNSSTQCPACAETRALQSMSAILNREEPVKELEKELETSDA